MEFDWVHIPGKLGGINPKEIEESFEDPFSIRILPDSDDLASREARYFILGRSVSNKAIFSVFWTDGKRYRVIAARPMSEAEEGFYERKNADLAN